MAKEQDYIFISKSLFFFKKGILVIGDLHIGYEFMLSQSGILVPEMQVKEVIEELKEIFDELKKRKLNLKKIIFIGDIKHSFGFEWTEKNYFNDVLNFLKNHFKEEDIIFIRGNHDTIDYSFEKRMKNYHIEGDVAFVHGHKFFLPVFNKKIKIIVMGHIHPSIILSDKQGIKREKYKCFLIGKFKGKKVIIMPSFLATIEGTTVNNFDGEYEDFFSIIPRKTLINFEVYVVGENRVYEFGKVKDLS